MVEETVITKPEQALVTLAEKAENAYSEIKGDALKAHLCERMFKALTCKSESGNYHSRPLEFGDLRMICEADEDRLMVIINLFRKRKTGVLVPTINEPVDDDTLIALSDEGLAEQWERLAEWADKEAASVKMYEALAAEAALFISGKRGYLEEPDLTEGLKWFNNNFPNPHWGARFSHDFDETIDFLFQSMEQANMAALGEEKEKSRFTFPRVPVAHLAGIMLVSAMVFGAYLFWPSGMFESKSVVAADEAVMIEKFEITTDTEAGYDSFIANLARQKAEEHAEKMKALGDNTESPILPVKTESKIWWQTAPKNTVEQAKPVVDIPEFLQAPSDEPQPSPSATVSTVVKADKKEERQQTPAIEAVAAINKPVTLSPTPQKPAVTKTEQPGEISLNLNSSVRDFAFHPFRQELIAGCANGTIQKIRVVNGTLKKSSRTLLSNEKIRSLDYSKDGRLVAAGTESGELVIFSNDNGKLTETARHSFDKVIQQVGFLSIHSSTFLAVGHVNAVAIAKVENNQVTITDEKKHNLIGAMHIDRSGNHILVGDLNRCVAYPALNADGKFGAPSTIVADANISSIAYDQSSKLLATGLVNGRLVLSKVNGSFGIVESKTLPVHRSLISSLDFHRQGGDIQLVSTGFDQTLTLLDVPASMSGMIDDDHRKFRGHAKWVYKGKFERSGKHMISSSEDGMIFIWNTADAGFGDDVVGYKR